MHKERADAQAKVSAAALLQSFAAIKEAKSEWEKAVEVAKAHPHPGEYSLREIDRLEDAITAARSAAERNGLSASFEVANVFDWFTEHREASFDLIILDPPSFLRSKSDIAAATRGYKDLNL